MRLLIVSVLCFGALAACYPGVGNFERESAAVITPTPYPDSVKISDVRHSMTMTQWVATTPSGVYDCSLASGERRPICAKRQSGR